MPDNQEFGKNLRITRECKQISQTELASISGIHPNAISHFEGGRRQPNLKNLVRLSKALNVSTDLLIFGK